MVQLDLPGGVEDIWTCEISSFAVSLFTGHSSSFAKYTIVTCNSCNPTDTGYTDAFGRLAVASLAAALVTQSQASFADVIQTAALEAESSMEVLRSEGPGLPKKFPPLPDIVIPDIEEVMKDSTNCFSCTHSWVRSGIFCVPLVSILRWDQANDGHGFKICLFFASFPSCGRSVTVLGLSVTPGGQKALGSPPSVL